MWLRKALLAAAAAAFATGIVLSLRSAPDLLSDVDWGAILIIAIIATPATLALNAVEFSLSARLIDQRIGFGRALTVTIIGSAANLLPVPGGTLVRLAAFKTAGASLRSGLSATVLLATLSLGLGVAYSGLWAALIGGSAIAFAMIVGGVLVLCIAGLIAREIFDEPTVVGALVLVRIGLIVLDAARTFFAFEAIGAYANFGQTSVLTVSTVLAAAVAIVPSGLGLREGLAAFMAPFVNLQPAATFLATSLSRIIGLAVVTVLTLLLTLRRKTPSAA